MEPISEHEAALIQEQAGKMLARCERVAILVGEVPLPQRTNCFACGGFMEFSISFRLNGQEMAWVNACGDHRDAPVRLTVSA